MDEDLFFKLPKSSSNLLEFNIKLDLCLPLVQYGCLYQLSYGILNELTQVIYNKGSSVFLHEHIKFQKIATKDFDIIQTLLPKINKNENDIDNMEKLRKYITFNEDDNDFFKGNSQSKWYFKDYSYQELFRKNIEPKSISGSKITEKITYIYSNDLIKADLLNIFKQIKKYKARNVCIKMLSVISSVSYDIVRIFNYCFQTTYIFKSPKDSKIKDSFYILGKEIIKDNLEYVIKNISNIESEYPLKQILNIQLEIDETLLLYRKLSINIQKIIFNEISNVI